MNKILVFLLLSYAFISNAQSSIKGVWQQKYPDGHTSSMLCSENYLMFTEYNILQKKYIRSAGGVYQILNAGTKKIISLKKEFNTSDPMSVGATVANLFSLSNNVLTIQQGPLSGVWQRIIEAGSSPILMNTWRLKAKEDNNLVMQTVLKGPLKTIKLLTKQHFQEVSFNAETQQFFGAFGGTFFLKNKKYLEKIAFNANEPKEVGQTLEYDCVLTGKDWIHAGQSTKGVRVHEIWEKVE